MKKAGSHKANKSKDLAEYRQVEDKIYTFLAQIGRKETSGND